MWPFREHTAMGPVEQPSNQDLESIEKLLSKLGLAKGSNWIPSLDHLSINALFQRPGHRSVYRAEAFKDNSGTHCRLSQELGNILLSPGGSVTSCSIKGMEMAPGATVGENSEMNASRSDA